MSGEKSGNISGKYNIPIDIWKIPLYRAGVPKFPGRPSHLAADQYACNLDLVPMRTQQYFE